MPSTQAYLEGGAGNQFGVISTTADFLVDKQNDTMYHKL